MASLGLTDSSPPPAIPHDSSANLDLYSKPIPKLLPETHPTAPPTSSLGIPLARHRSRSPDTLSLISHNDFVELQRSLSSSSDDEQTHNNGDLTPDRADNRRSKITRWASAFWIRNKGIFLVLFAQIFGCLMNVTTRLLENPTPNPASPTPEPGMHPFQILFARMSITTICATSYMWYTRTPDFPFGPKEVRWLLVARGIGGFWGVFGMYWSLQYLPLSDATILTFLGPVIACWACSKLINEPFTRIEQIGAFISLLGVVFIARPASIFSSAGGDDDRDSTPAAPPYRHLFVVRAAGSSPSIPEATPTQRLAAVGMAMVGVMGAAVAITTIRWIGRRAHPLILVNYFATWCTLVSTFFLVVVPSIPFVLPHTARQWMLLFFIGVSGFCTQYLLTAGLRYEKSSRSTNMVYTQMLFALLFDRLVWGIVPDATSLAGSGLILGCAIVVAVQKETAKKKDDGRGVPRDEEVALVDDQEDRRHDTVPMADLEPVAHEPTRE